ncbi:hypothetical protein VTP01DRAFT_9360 [Rhizomucor pusillus]|uniref:uncharacterized protein n=1 Tax=Rhizomucor pusillus TaxID=4840 RepID=UPI0037449F9B
MLWLVPIVSINATALVILGVALGPLYPSTVALASKTTPLRLYATSVGFLSAFGSGESALFPYITGVMIDAKGIGSVLPFCVAMASAMLAAWAFVPSKKME